MQALNWSRPTTSYTGGQRPDPQCSTTQRHLALPLSCSQHRHPARPRLQRLASLDSRRAGIQQLQWQRLHQTSRRSPAARIQAVFTGIVQGQGHVAAVNRQQDFSSIQIDFPAGSMHGVQVGGSVAINGTCLTVTDVAGDRASFDIISETLRATNLGELREGTPVNFERAARIGDEIGGHNVSGHVHTTASIASIEQTENNRRITFKVPQQWVKYILPKGFIAVDGTSLTVGEVGPDWFSVYLIPETLRVTVLGTKAEGDAVNIEIEAQTQAIVETVEKVVAQYLEARKLPA